MYLNFQNNLYPRNKVVRSQKVRIQARVINFEVKIQQAIYACCS